MRLLSDSIALDATDKDVMTLAPPDIGHVTRIGCRNPTAGAIDITLRDAFVLTPSAMMAFPTPQSKDRYSFTIGSGASIDIDGAVIAKIIGNFRVESSATGAVLSYVMRIN